MQANWSLICNILLLIGVIFGISRLMRSRKQSMNCQTCQPSLGPMDTTIGDDIISVRKIIPEVEINPSSALVNEIKPDAPAEKLVSEEEPENKTSQDLEAPKSIMMFILAKDNRQFAGYELLQTVLAAGLRFGEGQLFHRHQYTNGQGPIICSLAAATATGVFDMQNMGAFSVRGLCLFMQTSESQSIDGERFAIMLETARLLAEELDGYLLDEEREPLSEERLERYYQEIMEG